MARAAKKKAEMTLEEKLAQALVPEEDQPYQVPENWGWVYFGALIELISGRDAALSECNNEGIGIPYILGASSIENNAFSIERWIKEPQVVSQRGDILLSVKGTIGKLYIQQEELINISRQIMAIRPCYAIQLQYAYLFLMSVCEELREAGNGLIPGISRKDILEKAFPFAPIPEQQRIVDRIENLFAKLDEAKEKAQAVVDGFEDRKAAILHKAFTGELIGLSNGGLIPLERIVEVIRIGPFGSALHKEDYVLGGVPVINPKHIVDQRIAPEEKVTVSEGKAEELSGYKLRAGDIIMGRRGEMGRSAPVSEKEEGWLCGTGSLILRLKDGYDAKFYSQIIASHSSVRYLEENCVGSTMKNLNEKVIKNLPVPNYSISEQARIVTILSNIHEKQQQAKEAAEQVIDQIDTMKKSILSRAFRGELGTNDPNDESAVELLKRTLSE